MKKIRKRKMNSEVIKLKERIQEDHLATNLHGEIEIFDHGILYQEEDEVKREE